MRALGREGAKSLVISQGFKFNKPLYVTELLWSVLHEDAVMLTVVSMLEFQSEHQRAPVVQGSSQHFVMLCYFFFLTEVYKWVLADVAVKNGFKVQL